MTQELLNNKKAFAMDLFPAGTRIVLIHMEDVQAPPRGTKGTVTGVDALGDLLVDWDNGSGLKAILGQDIFIHDDRDVTKFIDQDEMESFCNRLDSMKVDYELITRNWGDGHIEWVVRKKEVQA